jgi:hypothetical protein
VGRALALALELEIASKVGWKGRLLLSMLAVTAREPNRESRSRAPKRLLACLLVVAQCAGQTPAPSTATVTATLPAVVDLSAMRNKLQAKKDMVLKIKKQVFDFVLCALAYRKIACMYIISRGRYILSICTVYGWHLTLMSEISPHTQIEDNWVKYYHSGGISDPTRNDTTRNDTGAVIWPTVPPCCLNYIRKSSRCSGTHYK